MWHLRPNTVLVEPGDASFWLNDLWLTDAFRALANDPDSGYRSVLEGAARRPWWFVDSIHAHEWRHFSIWFGQTFLRRNYDNPFVSDLYHWHDVLHAMTLRPDASGTTADWARRLRANEIAVSLETEVLVYLRHPALRPKTFDFPIWADRVVGGGLAAAGERVDTFREASRRNGSWAEQEALWGARGYWPLAAPTGVDDRELWDWRRAVALEPRDEVERGVAAYEGTTAAFFRTWDGRWKDAERERAAFLARCESGNWKGAVREREAHWERVSDAAGVPYGDVARRWSQA